MIWPLTSRRPQPIDMTTWRWLQGTFPFLAGMNDADTSAMRARIAAFVATKAVTGVHGLVPDDAVRLAIAAQACLPALQLDPRLYDDFVEIVVYPSTFRVRRRIVDDDGLVHDFTDDLSGEAMDGGPVVLSWDEVVGDPAGRAANVVIHEFVHKIDMADGLADGCPPMAPRQRAAWRGTLAREFDRFVVQVERAEASIPPHVDPETPEADPWYDALPLDPYAATDEAEFFAVAAEAFFVDPNRLASAFPDLHAAFASYFRTDPLARLGPRPAA